eukprot:EG_transcript_20126
MADGGRPLEQLRRAQGQLALLAAALEEAEDPKEYERVDAARRALLATRQRLVDGLDTETEAIADALARLLPYSPQRLPALPQPAVFCDFLYLGGQEEAEDLPALHALGISAILNCAAADPALARLQPAYPSEWEYRAIPAQDTELYPLLAAHASEAFAFLDGVQRAGRRALVHCVAGGNRSAALVVAYLVRRGTPLLAAAREVHARRPIILTNPGFRRQLVDFARQEELDRGTPLLPTEADLDAALAESAPREFDWTTYIF